MTPPIIETPATITPITGAVLVVRVSMSRGAGIAESVGGTEFEDKEAVVGRDELLFSNDYGRS